jgi:hypothetical protein
MADQKWVNGRTLIFGNRSARVPLPEVLAQQGEAKTSDRRMAEQFGIRRVFHQPLSNLPKPNKGRRKFGAQRRKALMLGKRQER